MTEPLSRGFELLDHPADMGFRAWAFTISDLFVECACALTSILVDLDVVSCCESVRLEILGDDLETLLYNWLAEILYLFDGEKKLFSEFVVLSHKTFQGAQCLEAELKGEQYSCTKHQIKTYVKAVTFHQLRIESQENGYSARVFLDI